MRRWLRRFFTLLPTMLLVLAVLAWNMEIFRAVWAWDRTQVYFGSVGSSFRLVVLHDGSATAMRVRGMYWKSRCSFNAPRQIRREEVNGGSSIATRPVFQSIPEPLGAILDGHAFWEFSSAGAVWNFLGLKAGYGDASQPLLNDYEPGTVCIFGPPSPPVRPSEMAVEIPYWMIVIVLGAMVLWQAVREGRRIYGKAQGRCVCGYDLRATTGRCPECGLPALTRRQTVGGVLWQRTRGMMRGAPAVAAVAILLAAVSVPVGTRYAVRARAGISERVEGAFPVVFRPE